MRLGAGSTYLALGRLFGLLAVFSVLTQLSLIGRSPWMEKIFGLDKLSRVHKLNGIISIAFILLHPIFITFGISLSANTGFFNQFFILVGGSLDILLALFGLLIFILTVGSSIYIVRHKLKYEYWYFIHIFNYLAIYLSFSHQINIGEDLSGSNLFRYYWFGLYTFVLSNHLIFRFLRPAYLFYKHAFKIEKIVKENYNTTSVYITGKNLENFKIRAGQFLIVRFLNQELWWQAHPFSLSALPSSKHIRLTIKNVGDFTSMMPDLKPGTPVIIDGPYGLFTDQVRTREKVLFIAGGVGITPIRSMIDEMLRKKLNLVLLYSNKKVKDILFKKELENLEKQHRFKLINILSGDKNYRGEKGRIDIKKIARLIKDVAERDVYLCGPPMMMDSVIRALEELKVPRQQIHYEKFTL